MYRASDRVGNAAWVEQLEAACTQLELNDETRATATDLFCSAIPDADRSKPATAAASLYAATLIAGEERSQIAVAKAMNVSRLSVQQGWKPILEDAGFSPPTW